MVRTSCSRTSSTGGWRSQPGLPGDGINGDQGGARQQAGAGAVRPGAHEESWRRSWRVACQVHGESSRGFGDLRPGGIHLLNGLYDAKLDGQPVLAITGHAYHDLIDTFSQQDVDLVGQAVHGRDESTTPGWRGRAPTSRTSPTSPAAPPLPTAGWPTSTSPTTSRIRGGERLRRATCPTTTPTSSAAAAPRLLRAPPTPQKAAEVLNKGKKVATILFGWPRRPPRHGGAKGAARRDAGRARSSRPCSARRRCRTTAPTPPVASGCSAPSPSQEALEACDMLLIVGSSFPNTEVLLAGAGAVARIDLDPGAGMGLRYRDRGRA